jgi:hypothetical protein
MAGLANLLQGILGQIGQSQQDYGPATRVGDHNDPSILWQPTHQQNQDASSSLLGSLSQPQQALQPDSGILYSLLNSGQSRHPGIGGGMPQTVSDMAAPPAAPQMSTQGLSALIAPQAQSMAQPAPHAAPEAGRGGFSQAVGDFFTSLVDPQAKGRNLTIDWLQKQGLDQGSATLLAGNKPALQSYLLQHAKGNGPTEFDQRAAAAQQYGLDPSTPEGRNFILSGKLDDGEKSSLINAGSGNIYDPKAGKWITAPNSGQGEMPARVREYEYAKQQGFPGSFNDWLASQKGGMSLQTNPDGSVTFQQGGNIKPLTEAQSKDTTFAVRAEGALPILDKFGPALTSFPESAAGALPGGVGNYVQSPEYQQAQQAGTEFLQAILRKDTGAAITPQETAEYGKVYLPRPGDSPATLAQKQVSRKRALEALKAGMTPQAIVQQEKALQKADAAGPSHAAPQKPVVIDGYTIEQVE